MIQKYFAIPYLFYNNFTVSFGVQLYSLDQDLLVSHF